MKVHVYNIQLLLLSPLECQLQVLTQRICSNNLGKPERAQHKQYIYVRIFYYYYGTSVTRNVCQRGSMDISTKYSIVHSHA